MKTRIAILALAVGVMLAANTGHTAPKSATNTALESRVTIELQDGSRVIGKLDAAKLAFESDVLGSFNLPVESIRSVKWAAKTNSAILKAVNGDELRVRLAVDELRVATSFSEVKLPVASLRQLQVKTWGGPVDLKPGLIALWSGEGNGNDPVGDNNATLSGHATFADGKVGQSFSFDGANSFAKIPQSPKLNLAEQLTISFWMKADADNPMNTFQGLVTSDFYAVEISFGYGGRMGVNFAISTTANQPGSMGKQFMDWNGARGRISTVANFTHISDGNGGGAPVTPGEWHHIAATYDGAQLQLYVDGQPWGNPVRHTGKISPMLPDSFLAIGSEDGRKTCPDCVTSRYFKGAIDEAAIYNRALSAAEIQSIFTEENNGDPMPSSTPPPGGTPFNSQFRSGGLGRVFE